MHSQRRAISSNHKIMGDIAYFANFHKDPGEIRKIIINLYCAPTPQLFNGMPEIRWKYIVMELEFKEESASLNAK